MKDSFYFVCIDFKEDCEIEILYLGIVFLRDLVEEIIVIDWCVLIVNFYYEGEIGFVFYEIEIDRIDVDL